MFLNFLGNQNCPITTQQDLFTGIHKLFDLYNYES
jgi:hypothetical protein